MAQYVFGSGVLWGTPLQDGNGTAISNPTPVQLGVLQEFSLDMSFELKELHGQGQFPVAVGRGKGKLTCKAKNAQLNGQAINSLIFGQTMSNGILSIHYDVTGAVIPGTPYAVTVTPPNSGTWSYDLGVRNANGLPMTRVASSPTTGQYSVAAGVYTFASADTADTVYISYGYTATSSDAKKSTIVNVLMGQAPYFRADYFTTYSGKDMVITLPRAIATKWTVASKQDDFMVPDIDFSGFADDAGNVLTYSLSE